MKYKISILFIFWLSNVNAQINQNDSLREIIIKDKKTTQIINTQTIDKQTQLQYQTNSLNHLLALHTNVFVKNYGVGSLSTISIRGSSAAQTAVLWHGLNLNNAMTGLADFSILPVSFFDEIKINYSSNTPNALAGHIELSNDKPNFTKKNIFQIGSAYESLQNSAVYASGLHANSHVELGIKGFYQHARNQFTYFNREKETFEKLTHAESETKGVIADLYVKLCSRQTISLHYWTQESTREIPAALFENRSTKNEKNQSTKALLAYSIQLNNWSTKTTLGMVNDRLDYSDSLIALSTRSHAITLPLTETIQLFPSSHQKITIQASAIYSKLITDKHEDLQRAYLSVHYDIEPRWRKLFIQSFIQQEFTNVFTLPLIAGFNIKRKLYKEYYLNASISSNYRTPTLNELYFTPGGNINLKPETSRNLEGGIEQTVNKRQYSLKTRSTLFTRDVKNWIVWYGGAILTPHNIQKVWSRGVEIDASFRYQLESVKPEPALKKKKIKIVDKVQSSNRKQATNLHFQLLYSYTLSTTKESAIANDYSVGKQLPYVPRYQVKMNMGLTKNLFEIYYVYAYTGYRFVTTDESEYLLPYNTHNLFASYQLHLGKQHQLLTTFKVNNILNKSYESIVGRIMPGRNFSVGLNYWFKH